MCKTWGLLKRIYASQAIAFSPDTSLNCTPNKVTICAAIGQRGINLFHTDLNQESSVQTLSGHTDYVNDLAWVCDGELLASVSDDFSCKFWNITTDLENVITFCLSSAGMSVKCHPEDSNKVLIAEKRGMILNANFSLPLTVINFVVFRYCSFV